MLPAASAVNEIEFSPDGRRVATLASPFFGEVRPGAQIWDVASGLEVGPARLSECDAAAFAWAPDSQRFVISRGVSPRRGLLEIWSVDGKDRDRLLAEEESAIDCVAWSPDGRWIAAGESADSVRIWNVQDGKPLRKLPSPGCCLAFSPDSKKLVVGNKQAATIWQLPEGIPGVRFPANLGRHNAIRFSSDGELVGMATDQGIVLWYAATGKRAEFSPGFTGAITDLEFSTSGRYLASADFSSHARVWDLSSGREIRKIRQSGFAVGMSPDGKTLALATRRISLRDFGSWRIRHRHGHLANLRSLQITPDDRTLISADSLGMILFWDLESGREKRRVIMPSPYLTATALSPDGRTLAAGSSDGGSVFLWDVESGKEKGRLAIDEKGQSRPEDGSKRYVSGLEFSADGDQLVVGDDSGTTRIWDVARQQQVSSRKQSLALKTVQTVYTRDGTLRADKSIVEGIVEVRTSAGKTLFSSRVTPGPFLPVVFSRKGDLLLTSSEAGSWFGVRVLDARTGKEIRQLAPVSGYLTAITCSADGKRVATAEQREQGDNLVRVWDAVSGEEIAEFADHPTFVQTLAFTKDTTRLISGSDDTRLLVWRVPRSSTPDK